MKPKLEEMHIFVQIKCWFLFCYSLYSCVQDRNTQHLLFFPLFFFYSHLVDSVTSRRLCCCCLPLLLLLLLPLLLSGLWAIGKCCFLTGCFCYHLEIFFTDVTICDILTSSLLKLQQRSLTIDSFFYLYSKK